MNTEDFDFTCPENPVEAGSALLFLAGFVLISPEFLRLIRTEAGEHIQMTVMEKFVTTPLAFDNC